eukprot:scaffold5187_cov23-Tisochrysis_lutea.AAC.2
MGAWCATPWTAACTLSGARCSRSWPPAVRCCRLWSACCALRARARAKATKGSGNTRMGNTRGGGPYKTVCCCRLWSLCCAQGARARATNHERMRSANKLAMARFYWSCETNERSHLIAMTDEMMKEKPTPPNRLCALRKCSLTSKSTAI